MRQVLPQVVTPLSEIVWDQKCFGFCIDFGSWNICMYIMRYPGDGTRVFVSYTPDMHSLRVSLYNIVNNFGHETKVS